MLPKISQPATRALNGIGITSLDQVANYSKEDLLKLHGVGPKAIRILDEALNKQGKTFLNKTTGEI